MLNSFEEMVILLQQMAAEQVCWLNFYTILMIMFPSLSLELSGTKGLILTVLINQIVLFSVIPLWVSELIILSESEENSGKKKKGQLNFHCLSLLLKTACGL